MERSTTDSAGCLVFRLGQVLLIRHRGRFGFPKGHQEEGESLEETASRETKEETGLEVKLLSSVPVTVPSVKEGDERNVHYYPAVVIGGEERPQEGEVEEVLWLPVPQALDQLSFLPDRDALEKLWETIRFEVKSTGCSCEKS